MNGSANSNSNRLTSNRNEIGFVERKETNCALGEICEKWCSMWRLWHNLYNLFFVLSVRLHCHGIILHDF